ncbi:Receptor-like kinase [Thalictrum thalictroides]|uniref:Receptor-like kinase n=1 Tax=Thalictrum thalictroides TaxID=46969 RepID=A0A7J6X3U5_THATH|nr:Receptor-like kinase [Thalictrum thalictroides]
MVDLDHLKQQVERRSKLYREDMDGWLHKVEDKQREMEEIQSKLNELKIHGFHLSNLNDRHQLNKRVIENLNAVNIIKEIGNACPESIRAILSEIEIGKPRAFSPADIMIITSHLSESNIIRSDLFGKVYKGKFHNGKQVSVKVLVNKDVSQEIFMSEVTTLSNTSHRHLTKLYGYCFEHSIIALVYEYMENGSFAEILFQNPHTVEWDKCYGIAIKTAKAIAYLHEGCDNQIIHHDIKASNVLLDNKFSPKVADFGVAKLIKDGRSHLTLTRTRGTPGYAAPEMWILSSRITCACDVYSFGMMLFEILGMRKHFQKGEVWFPQHVWNKFESGQLDDIIEECGISEKNKIKARTLALVALWCAQFKPRVRPSMSVVVQMLEMRIPVKNPPTNPFIK